VESSRSKARLATKCMGGRDNRQLNWLDHGQCGSYQLAHRISTDKRASVYRTDSLPDVGYPGNYRDTFRKYVGRFWSSPAFCNPPLRPFGSWSRAQPCCGLGAGASPRRRAVLYGMFVLFLCPASVPRRFSTDIVLGQEIILFVASSGNRCQGEIPWRSYGQSFSIFLRLLQSYFPGVCILVMIE
jgi:hypothetical protein